MENTKKDKLRTFLESLETDIDILNYIDIETVESSDDIYEQIEENRGFDVEIIYYASAMEYLRENDPSLQESLGIADDFGYEPKNLNSEILASLLASENAREDFADTKREIDDFFEALNKEEY